MDIREGEKISGVIREITDEGYSVALCNDIQGFAPKESLSDSVDPSNLQTGSEVKVRVREKTTEGTIKLIITKLFAKDKFEQKPDKYLKNLSYEKNNGGDTGPEPKVAEEFQEWLNEIETTFEEIKENRKERLNEDFWTV